MFRIIVLMLFSVLLLGPRILRAEATFVLDPDAFRHHVEFFNRMVEEEVVNHIPNEQAWPWMKANIPLFECPDGDVEQVYYYRWWALRKHIKQTPKGFIFTEFLKPVAHAAEYNAISCAFGHHVAEARWLREQKYLQDYISFWLRSGEDGGLHPRFHQFSGWAADALYQRWLVDGDTEFLVSFLEPLLRDYRDWERDRQLESGLFWQYDVADGMEESISGSRKAKNARPTINSYMYGNAKAIAAIAAMAHEDVIAKQYSEKAEVLRRLVDDTLWDQAATFFKTLLESGDVSSAREQIGFTPWYFDLPAKGQGYEKALKQLMDPKGFHAPYGPTTAEQRHPGFRIAIDGDDCQWNGPSWPFATTITLKALANVLNNYTQDTVTNNDYFDNFQIYTRSQHIQREDGSVIPWIDENLNPFTGEWWARHVKILEGSFTGRGDHYNHSGYADLLITGLVGLRPRADDVIEVHPLLPEDTWDWFCLDGVRYRNRTLTILWDKTGEKYGKGKGLRVFADGNEIAQSPKLERITGRLAR